VTAAGHMVRVGAGADTREGRCRLSYVLAGWPAAAYAMGSVGG
jgi:hypothetical protein